MSTINKIKSLEKKRAALLDVILSTKKMLRGKFTMNYRRCGRATCWCVEDEKGHPANRIGWKEDGKSYSRIIANEDVSWAKELTENYRAFRRARKELRDLNEQLRILLNTLEEQVVNKTKKVKKFE